MRKLHGISLYYRLFFIFGLTYISIGWVVSIFIRDAFEDPTRRIAYGLLNISAPQIISELGENPAREDLKRISEKFRIEVYQRNLNAKWPSELKNILMETASEDEFVRVRSASSSYLIRPQIAIRSLSFGDKYTSFLTCGVLILLVLLANSFVIRKILRPIEKLEKMALDYGQGKLTHRLQVDTDDEIGTLIKTFNAMADRIENQVESLKQLAIGVSHEIRTPLTRMRMAIETLSESTEKTLLQKQVVHIDEVTESILERETLNSGLTSLFIGEVDLCELLTELCEYYRSSEQKIDLLFPSSLVVILADRRRLEILLKNVIDNAFEHGKGICPVKVKVTELEGRIVITVEDFGSDLGGHTKIKPVIKFGVGLQLSKSIAKAHGGDLEIETERDDGIEVKVTLPLKSYSWVQRRSDS